MINLKATKQSQRIQPTKLFKLPQDNIKNLPKAKPLSKDELEKNVSCKIFIFVSKYFL
jgi:hypothetical protein